MFLVYILANNWLSLADIQSELDEAYFERDYSLLKPFASKLRT